MVRSRTLRIVIGIAISLSLLFAVFYKIHFVELWTALKKTSFWDLFLCICFFGLNCIARAFISHFTIRSIKRTPFFTLLGGVVVGYMANNLLPLRAGELVRAHYLSRKSGISGGMAFSTVCIERVTDVFSLCFLLVAAIWSRTKGLSMHNAEGTIVLMAALISGIVVFLIAFNRLIYGKEKKYHGFLSHAFRMIEDFLKPIGQLRQPKTFFLVILLSLTAWACNYFSLFFLIRNWSSPSLEAALLLLLFINLGMLLPSSPGAVGVMQFAFWMALAPFNIYREQALALSFAYQFGLYLFTLPLGVAFYSQIKPGITKITEGAEFDVKADDAIDLLHPE